MSIAIKLEAIHHAGIPLHERLQWYARQFRLEFKAPVADGKQLRNQFFAKVVDAATQRLNSADQDYLRSYPVLISDSIKYGGRERSIITAGASLIPDGSRVIVLYQRAILNVGKEHGYAKSFEEYVDWVQRLLLHEIGHARDGRSDADMAEREHY